MGGAMAKAVAGSGLFENKDILVFDKDETKTQKLAEEIGVNVRDNEKEVAEDSDYLVLAVKPFHYKSVLEEIKGHIKDDALIIVIAVGINFEDVYDVLGETKVVRVQPSTPAMVLESATTFYPDENITKEEIEDLHTIFKTFGTSEVLSEELMAAVPSIASSAPAYALMLISAMADGACLHGFSREQATRLSAQSVLGAAKLVLESGESPDVLKDRICTPGGTTIEAVCKLEECGFRSSVIKAVDACAKKSKKMLQ